MLKKSFQFDYSVLLENSRLAPTKKGLHDSKNRGSSRFRSREIAQDRLFSVKLRLVDEKKCPLKCDF
jgi:hypothetical protein